MAALEVLQQVADQLTAGGLRATVEVRDAHPPCALVIGRTWRPVTACLVDVTIDVVLIAPGVGNGDALTWLTGALEQAWEALGRRVEANLTSWTSPHTGQALLSMTLTENLRTAI